MPDPILRFSAKHYAYAREMVKRGSPPAPKFDLRSSPESGLQSDIASCPKSPNSDIAPLHSITSSAIASTPGGIVRPSALAVLRLMTNSNLVALVTGRSAGFSPLRTRPV